MAAETKTRLRYVVYGRPALASRYALATRRPRAAKRLQAAGVQLVTIADLVAGELVLGWWLL